MRKLVMSLATVCVVAGLGGVAQASSPQPNVIVGTAKGDFLVGTSAPDAIFGKSGADWIWAGKGRDIVYAGRGRDQVRAADGQADQIFCGPGKRDGAVVDQKDTVRGCEHVVVMNVKGDGDGDNDGDHGGDDD